MHGPAQWPVLHEVFKEAVSKAVQILSILSNEFGLIR
jgi:hypothetical protein